MALIDTNIALRWLLGDHAVLSEQAEQLVESSTDSSLLVADVVVAEIVYVLRGTSRDRQQTADALALIALTPGFALENPKIIKLTIHHYVQTSLDFVDCYLLARHQLQRTPLHTFDKKLERKLAND